MKKLLVLSMLIASMASTAFANDTATLDTTAVAAPAATTATITISAKHKATIVATADINWAPQSNERLAIKWTAPDNNSLGNCHNSSLAIKTGTTHLHSSRTPWYESNNGAPIACKGTWTASVVNTVTEKVLATAQYTITL